MAKLNWLQRETVVTPHMILCGSEAEYLNVMKYLKCKYFEHWLSDGSNGKTHTLESHGKITCVVCIDFKNAAKEPLPNICGILIHEATHIWQELCESIGEKNPSSEFECYSIQSISQRLITDFMEHGKWKKGS